MPSAKKDRAALIPAILKLQRTSRKDPNYKERLFKEIIDRLYFLKMKRIKQDTITTLKDKVTKNMQVKKKASGELFSAVGPDIPVISALLNQYINFTQPKKDAELKLIEATIDEYKQQGRDTKDLENRYYLCQLFGALHRQSNSAAIIANQEYDAIISQKKMAYNDYVESRRRGWEDERRVIIETYGGLPDDATYQNNILQKHGLMQGSVKAIGLGLFKHFSLDQKLDYLADRDPTGAIRSTVNKFRSFIFNANQKSLTRQRKTVNDFNEIFMEIMGIKPPPGFGRLFGVVRESIRSEIIQNKIQKKLEELEKIETDVFTSREKGYSDREIELMGKEVEETISKEEKKELEILRKDAPTYKI